MMHKLSFILVSFTLFSCVLSQAQNHPLCGTDGTRLFVADPSSCHGYLHCRWNGTEAPIGLISVHQLDCRSQSSNHFDPSADGTTGTCVDLRVDCEDDLQFFCTNNNDIMVANHTDPTCTQYRPCRLPGFPWMTCRSPLVFNRNTGACDLEVNAPCSEPINTVQCPIGGTGNFPGQFCWTFIFCFEGNQMGNEFECPVGWKFDESINDCAEDSAGSCVRPQFDFVPPRVQNGVSRKQKKEINIKIEGF